MTTLCIWISSLSSPDWYFCNSDFLVLISLFGITTILWISLLFYAYLSTHHLQKFKTTLKIKNKLRYLKHRFQISQFFFFFEGGLKLLQMMVDRFQISLLFLFFEGGLKLLQMKV